MDRGRVVSPLFVGRGSDLGRLGELLHEAANGEPAVVLVSGEAGVGKSRLVAELLATRVPPDTRVLLGECNGFAPGSFPYGPIAGALRRLLHSSEARADLLGDTGEALALLLPELKATGRAIAAPLDQAQMFSQLEAVFDKLSASAPLMLVIEDLHWADRSSLEFLAYLCHGLHWQRLGILCTYRDHDVPAAPALGAWLADLRRHPRLTEISLPRFTVAELGEQVAAILGGAPDPSLVKALHERSSGNPYYTELLLAGVGPQGRPGPSETAPKGLPAALREVLLARLAGMAAGTREVLAIIAAAGHPVSHAALTAACAQLGVSEQSLLAALREAVDRQVLVGVADPPGYAFRHALLAEATYDQLLPGERVRLHGAWASVLEERLAESGHAGSAAAEIALHHHKADHPRLAFGWDLRAAETAERVGGVAEAADCYRRMLATWDDIRDAEQEAGFDRIELLTRLSKAEELAGDVSSVRRHIEEAITLADPAIDPLRAALLQDRLCWSLYLSGRPSAALGIAAAAVGLVPESPPSFARMVVLAGLGRVQVLVGRGGRAEAAATAAAAIADQLGDPIAAALVAQLQARVAWLTGRPRAVPMARQALQLALQTGIQDLAMIAFDGLAEALDAAGNDRGVLQACYGGYGQTRQRGGANYGAWLLCRAVFNLIACGRTEEAARVLDTALRVRPSGILDVYGQMGVALLATVRGDFDAGRAAIERCRQGFPEGVPFGQRYCATAAELELWAREPERAFSNAHEGIASVAHNDYRRHAGMLAWLALRAAADRAELAAARQDVAARNEARLDADRLWRMMAGPPWLTAEPESRARAFHALIEAEQLRLAGQTDPERWALASRCSRSCSRPHLAAYAAWRQAEALLAQHAPRQASGNCLRRAYATASRIGAAPLQHELQTLARYARIELDRPASDERPRPVPAALQALTIREREILDQLASGLSNKQIAERLYISPRTAGVHVSNILHKLDVPDRVQAAHLARKIRGL